MLPESTPLNTTAIFIEARMIPTRPTPSHTQCFGINENEHQIKKGNQIACSNCPQYFFSTYDYNFNPSSKRTYVSIASLISIRPIYSSAACERAEFPGLS